MTNFQFSDNNQINLLHNGAEYFPQLEAAIENSQTEIHLETYIYESDTVGQRISAALCRAAQRGVSTYLLIDGFGSQNFPKTEIERLLQSGVKVLIFRPEIIFSMPHRHRLRRMHRKIAIIDAKIAFVGGINIIDDRDNPEQLVPRFDFTVSIQGPLLSQIHQAVKHLWMLVAWVHFKKRWAVSLPEKPLCGPTGNQKAAFIIRDNWRHRHDIEHAYLDAINQAQIEIIIANAYFLPGRKFNQALKNAAQRGVSVLLLLQGKAEYRLQYHATQALYKNLLAAGIEIYEYHRSYMHAKVAVIDRRWSTVGSSNIDPFSLLLAREANIIVEDNLFSQILRARLTEAITQESTAITAKEGNLFSWFSDIINWLCFYIVRIMQGMLGYDWYDSPS